MADVMEMDESPDWAVGSGVQGSARRQRHVPPQQIRAAMLVDQTRTACVFFVADTNVYIHSLALLDRFVNNMGPGKGAVADMGAVSLECFVIVPQAVWRELDSLKCRVGRQQAAHSAIRMVNDHSEHSPQPFFIHQTLDLLHRAEAISVTPDGVRRNSDDAILQCCLLYSQLLQARPAQANHSDRLVLLTNDENLIGKAQAAGVQAHRSDALSPRDATTLYQQVNATWAQVAQAAQLSQSGQSVLQHEQLHLQQQLQQQQQLPPLAHPQYAAQQRQVSQPMSPEQRPLPHLHGSGSAPAALVVTSDTKAADPRSTDWLGAATEALNILLASLQPAVAAVLSHTLGADIWQDCLAPQPPWRHARQMLDALRQARDSLGLSQQDSSDFFRARGELWAQAGELDRYRSKDQDAAFVRRVLEACRQMLSIARRCVATHAAAPDWPEACDATHIMEQLQADDDHLRMLAKRLLLQ